MLESGLFTYGWSYKQASRRGDLLGMWRFSNVVGNIHHFQFALDLDLTAATFATLPYDWSVSMIVVVP